MKKQSDFTYIPDWQIMNYSGTEAESNQETDGIEEEKEHRFYSSANDGYGDPQKQNETKQLLSNSPM